MQGHLKSRARSRGFTQPTEKRNGRLAAGHAFPATEVARVGCRKVSAPRTPESTSTS